MSEKNAVGRRLSGWVMAGLWAAGVAAALPAAAWTPGSQVTIAETAAGLAPPDLVRQIAKHQGEYRKGVLAAFQDGQAERHRIDERGGELDQVILYEVGGAVAAIRAHRPMEEIVYRLGVVSHYLADANFPLNTSASDPGESTYFADFARYLESAQPRVRTVFYGLRPAVQHSSDLRPMLEETLNRSRRLYPRVGDEYRRIDEINGQRYFDDRSTAFAIAALSYSHAITDVAEVLRWIWVQAGGADSRVGLPVRGERLVVIPKIAAKTAR
jgi:hypothetical protein